MAGVGYGTGYASAPHDTVEKVVSFISTAQMIRSATLVGGFIFAVMNRKLWFGADLLVTAVSSLVLILAPQMLLDFQISRQVLDGVDLQVARMLGCVLFGNSVLWFFATKKTTDPDTVHPALLLTRVISNAVLLIAVIDIQLFSKAWGPEHLTFGALGVLLWLVGNLVHLIRGGYRGGHVQRGQSINNFLLFDFGLSTCLGFTLYGFPRWFLRNFTLVRTLDGAHEHLTRTVGAAIFGTGLYAFQAVGFLDDRDKEAHFIQRLVINCLLMLSTAYAQIFYYREWNANTSWAIQFFLVLWTIHAYLGWKAERVVYNRGLRGTGGYRVTRERYVSDRPITSATLRTPGLGGKGLVPDAYGDYDRED